MDDQCFLRMWPSFAARLKANWILDGCRPALFSQANIHLDSQKAVLLIDAAQCVPECVTGGACMPPAPVHTCSHDFGY